MMNNLKSPAALLVGSAGGTTGAGPRIFRASGPDRTGVMLDGARLIAEHGCVINVLSAMRFDAHDCAIMADVGGASRDRRALAPAWHARLGLHTVPAEPRSRENPVVPDGIGTELVEIRGRGHDIIVDALDLISGEWRIPMSYGHAVRRPLPDRLADGYLLQVVCDVGRPLLARRFYQSLSDWAAGRPCQLRVVPLREPAPGEPVLAAPAGGGPPPVAAGVITPPKNGEEADDPWARYAGPMDVLVGVDVV